MAEEGGVGWEVTATEAKVLSILFEATPGSDAERIRRSGLPQSTYQQAKRRLYGRELIRDRYIPHPPVFGFHSATITLTRPFAEHFETTLSSLAENPRSVVVWAGQSIIFSILLHRNSTDAQRILPTVVRDRGPRSITMEANLDLPSVPCYFDFEGAWKNLAGIEGVNGYPRPLGGELSRHQGGHPSVAQFEAAARLVSRPFSPGGEEKPAHLLGPHTLPRTEQQMVQKGWVQWRVLPTMPAFRAPSGARVTKVVFIQGALRQDASPSFLFRELVSQCRTFPFLFCTDGRKVLLASLGTDKPLIFPNQAAQQLPSVEGILKRSLEEIEVIAAPLHDLRVIVDQRYDRLFSHG
jgi:hypothetical protein